MRQVYRIPSTKTSSTTAMFGAMLLTLAVFLVLPMTQMVSSGTRDLLDISKIDTAVPPPPPDPVEMEQPPPPPEPENEPPPPELSDAPRPLSLGDLDLDMAVGTGGALLGGAGGFSDEAALNEVAIFDIADLDQRPQPIARVSPRHPPELLKAKVSGHVVLLFVIDENGRVLDPRVESSSQAEFEKPALTAVRRWRFKAGTRDGESVRTYIRQQIQFRVN